MLVVSDDPLLRRDLPGLLSAIDIHTVVADASHAVESIDGHAPDMVILDLYMGAEDTWQRLRPRCPGSTVIVPGRFTDKTTAKRMGATFIDRTAPQAVAAAVAGLRATGQ